MSHLRFSTRSVLSLSLLSCSILEPILHGGSLPAQTEDLSVFPLDPGRTWTYAGKVRWTPPGSAQVQETTLEWRMEVIDRLERLWIDAALLKGHPQDLAWYEEGRAPGRYLMVQVAGAGAYLLEGERVTEAWERLRDPSDHLVNLLEPNELAFELPLQTGRRSCEPDQIARQDGLYCWVVESAETVDLGGVEGISPGERTAYRLALRTFPDHQIVDLVPGVGLTAFIYGHHGTISEVDVHLVRIEPFLPEPPAFRQK